MLRIPRKHYYIALLARQSWLECHVTCTILKLPWRHGRHLLFNYVTLDASLLCYTMGLILCDIDLVQCVTVSNMCNMKYQN